MGLRTAVPALRTVLWREGTAGITVAMQSVPPASAGRPIAAVLAVVIRDGQVLLVQRANPPDAGLWGFPGGRLEFGEPVLAAAERALLEETGVKAVAKRVFTATDAVDRSEDGDPRQHFVLIAILCQWLEGEPLASDDALDARWIPIQEMETAVHLSRDVAAVASQAAFDL